MIKILYADDFSCNMLPRRLTRKGFECVLAEDGEEAVKLAHSELPDLILMDMSLPVKQSWVAAKEIKEAQATKHIPIIALTAYSALDDRKLALEAGCDDYDTKPVELPRLLEKINRLLCREKSEK